MSRASTASPNPDAPEDGGTAPTSAVRNTLLEYAERGVFRGFSHEETEPGRTSFRFSWLAGRSFRLTFDEETATLCFERLLPGVGEDSEVRVDLERLIRKRVEGDVPEHRRVHPDRAVVELRSRDGGDADLVLRVIDDDLAYGVRKILNLANEIWVRLNYAHQRYMWQAFDAPME